MTVRLIVIAVIACLGPLAEGAGYHYADKLPLLKVDSCGEALKGSLLSGGQEPEFPEMTLEQAIIIVKYEFHNGEALLGQPLGPRLVATLDDWEKFVISDMLRVHLDIQAITEREEALPSSMRGQLSEEMSDAQKDYRHFTAVMMALKKLRDHASPYSTKN